MFGPPWRLMEEKQAPDDVRQAIVAETAAAFEPYVTRAGLRGPGTVLIAKSRRSTPAQAARAVSEAATASAVKGRPRPVRGTRHWNIPWRNRGMVKIPKMGR